MGFHEVRFPASLSFGSVGGPERRTEVVTLANGFEERNTPWAHSRRRYDAGVGMRSLDDVEMLIAFFEARRGQMFGFRWKDWADFKSGKASVAPQFQDQVIATGDGSVAVFQLNKTYRSGLQSYTRPIAKPVAGSVKIGIQGDPMREGVEFEVDTATGLVSFAHPPDEGVEITAGFEFDVPVRFDTDRIQTSVASFQAGDVPNVPVIEVRV
ncbi:phage distal tail protein, Rcc01695 family [Pseudogemmobacter sp. W21_MBD1_M6]|uniref:phage distal tail protein, Rcc01695 family n=1 Tax=Pseudogemmobacter sp. W21_MBD1_M6 TaxID=3240271 RepID=UPI003F96C2A3